MYHQAHAFLDQLAAAVDGYAASCRSRAVNGGARGGKAQSYLNPRGLRILDALDTVAQRYDSTPVSVALAWLIARPSITAPIASATTLSQMEALIAATQLSLDGAAIGQRDEASAA